MIKKFYLILFLNTLLSQFSVAQTTPNALNDSNTTNINTSLLVNEPGVLNNDTDANNNTLTITSFSINSINYTAGETATFTEGNITLNSNGSYIYIPSTNYTGNTSVINYTVSNGTFSTSANLQIAIENLNQPIAIDNYDTAEINTVLAVNAPGVLINDTDLDNTPLTVTQFSINSVNYNAGETATFTEGTITINSNGSYNFNPTPNYTGNVSVITYTLFDGTYTTTANLLLTVENITDLIEITRLESCNQGYTANGEYKISYNITFRNSSTARDYHASNLINNIDLTNNLQATFGTGCVTEIDDININTSQTTDYINNPYPLEFNDATINPDFLNATSASIFSSNTINNAILYPRQSVNISFCVTVNPFCNGRPNPTPSGSGIDFNTTLNITSSIGNATNNLLLTDFHTTQAVVTAALFIPETNPLVNSNGTFDYTNSVIITNEGTATATNVNYNMGLGSFLDNGIIFDQLVVSQISGPPVTINTNYNGNTSPLLLNTNNSLQPGETIILNIFYLIEPISNTNTNYFSQIGQSQTQGSLDSYDETTATNTRNFSFVNWSDSLGNHLDRYYPTSTATETASSSLQCTCSTSNMSFSFQASSNVDKIISNTNTAPNGILEHEQLTFQVTITNTSKAIQLQNLQLQNSLNTICSGNIISVSTPIIENSTATIPPIINTTYNGTSDVNFFNGTSGILETNQSITIEFSVLFNENCTGISTSNLLTTDPLNNTINATASININATTDTDNDTITNNFDIDNDNDTIRDIDEYNGLNPVADHDNDFIPNYRDIDFGTDANNDGIVDIFDFDNDGVPNHFDLDSDNDGIFDIVEAGNALLDTNLNGTTNNNVGINGLDNSVEINDTTTTNINYIIINTDNNGNPNFIDIDADDDGIVDNIEAQTTSNYTAPNNTYTLAGIDTAYSNGIVTVDTDGDFIPDYIDNNSDNDIRNDYIEAWDLNNDGIPETTALNLDTDNDGLDDAFDTNNNSVNPTNNQTPTFFPNVDNTDTPEKDWREIIAIVVLINNAAANESENIIFTISLVTKNNNAILVQSASPISINLNTTNGTTTTTQYTVANAPYDYNQVSNTTINIPAYQETAQFAIPTLDDTIYELNELFTINGIITSQNTINNSISAVGTIINNDLAPLITMNNATANEGTNLAHTISISHPSSTPINITVKTTNNQAISPNDYTSTTKNLTIQGTENPNNTNTQVSFTIPTIIDNLNEPDTENLNVTGTVTSNNVSSQDLNKIASIIDIDPTPIIQINNPTVTEGDNLVFTIKLLNANLEPMLNYQPINLSVETFDNTTTGSLDYQTTRTSNTIPAYTNSITITIPTTNDNINENTETMVLQTTITSTNATIISTGTIKDDDIPNLFSPNGDGKSDVFKIAGIEEFPNFKLIIYDRWGSEIYNYSNNGSTTPLWWNGNHKGKPVPAGVYYYTLNFNDGKTKAKTNFIQLTR
ncbi:gliding motility-associated C-terminal domain-containing protein [Tenacibaculum aestuariivivum]|uniref:T9SS type B sorting domain-containing protein n=1 Tax=Tenacibaculum aestuariivivum TaxID=2006131 RepID=UPI003AB64C17